MGKGQRLIGSRAPSLALACLLAACSHARHGRDAGVPRDGAAMDVVAGAVPRVHAADGGDEGPSRVVHAIDLAVGDDHACALLDDGSVWCWGDDRSQQAAGGSIPALVRPVRVEGVAGAMQITAGARHSCALAPTGRVTCWGENVEGEAGGPRGTFSVWPPGEVSGLTSVVEVRAGGLSTCARLANHSLRCWGANPFGQLGDGTTESRRNAAPVLRVSSASALSVGASSVCVANANGTAMCWGLNVSGAVGDGSLDEHHEPVAVVGLTAVTSIAVGSGFACALDRNGTVSCWGTDQEGELGDRSHRDRPRPGPVPSLDRVVQIAAGSAHACAVRDDGMAWCWGDNGDGQLGDGTAFTRRTPVRVHGLDRVRRIEAGASRTCALRDDGSVWCWGRALAGDGSTIEHYVPVGVRFPRVEDVRPERSRQTDE